jgi:photoactive yellow protein
MASGKPGSDPDELLTTRQAAEIVGVGTTSIKRWSDEGKLPAIKTAGGHRRYRRRDVELLISDQNANPSLHTQLPSMSRAELDALDVGVIQLDDAGYVLIYNKTESEFANIPVKEAEGQHFFGELAPCTNNRILYGRFQEGVRSGHLDARISYTFTYKMRPTHVNLHLYRDPASKTNWLIVAPTG